MTSKKTKSTTKKKPEPKKVEKEESIKDIIDTNKKRGDPVGAIFLISLGAIFLLNNFGLLPWSIWGYIWRFWPVFLILSGIRMILGRNVVSSLLVSIIGIFVVGMMLIYISLPSIPQFDSWLETNIPEFHNKATTLIEKTENNIEEKIQTVDRDSYEDVTKRIIELEIGARTVTLDETDDDVYLSLDTNYVTGHSEPEIKESLVDNILTLSLDSTDQSWGWGVMKNPYMKLEVGEPEIATDLSLNLGAGTFKGTLEDLIVQSLTAEIGAGTMVLELSENNLEEVESISLNVNAGTIDLSLPDSEDIGYKISYEVGVGTLSIDSNSLRGDGNYTTDNYDDADKKVDIAVEVGVGTIDIDLD